MRPIVFSEMQVPAKGIDPASQVLLTMVFLFCHELMKHLMKCRLLKNFFLRLGYFRCLNFCDVSALPEKNKCQAITGPFV